MKDVIMLIERTSEEKLKRLDKDLPSDTHLVRVKKKSWKKKEQIMAIRAYRQVDIFDALHDEGWVVLEIRSGFGRIKPKMYQYQPKT